MAWKYEITNTAIKRAMTKVTAAMDTSAPLLAQYAAALREDKYHPGYVGPTPIVRALRGLEGTAAQEEWAGRHLGLLAQELACDLDSLREKYAGVVRTFATVAEDAGLVRRDAE